VSEVVVSVVLLDEPVVIVTDAVWLEPVVDDEDDEDSLSEPLLSPSVSLGPPLQPTAQRRRPMVTT
jgi:hypothetical protein